MHAGFLTCQRDLAVTRASLAAIGGQKHMLSAQNMFRGVRAAAEHGAYFLRGVCAANSARRFGDLGTGADTVLYKGSLLHMDFGSVILIFS